MHSFLFFLFSLQVTHSSLHLPLTLTSHSLILTCIHNTTHHTNKHTLISSLIHSCTRSPHSRITHTWTHFFTLHTLITQHSFSLTTHNDAHLHHDFSSHSSPHCTHLTFFTHINTLQHTTLTFGLTSHNM